MTQALETEMGEDFRAYVISLRNDNPRRADLIERFGARDFQFQVLDAIDGRAGLSQAYEAEVDRASWLRRYARQPTDAELACALSHREACRHFLKSGATYALIMEDDAIFDGRLNEFVEREHFRIAPIVLLYYGNAYVKKRGGIALPGTGAEARRLAVSPVGATAYSLRRDMAARFIEAQSPVRCVADFPLDLSTCDGMATVPRIVGSPLDKRSSMIGARPHTMLARLLRRLGDFEVVRARLRKQWRKLTSTRVPKEHFRRG